MLSFIVTPGSIRSWGVAQKRNMDSEEEKEQGKRFKVDDRRRFSAEGELKPEHRGSEQVEVQPSAAPRAADAVTIAAGSETGSRAREAEASKAFSHHRDAEPEITFPTFVVGLSTQALVHLGELPDPHTNQPATDLPAAQQLIDIIAMLEKKTRGNLDHDEQSMLEAILFELRMKYVERSRH
jgi:hypothetical protein